MIHGTRTPGLAVEAVAVGHGESSYSVLLAHFHEIGVNPGRLAFSRDMVENLYFQKNR